MILDRLTPTALDAVYRTLLVEHDGRIADEAGLLRVLLATPALAGPAAERLRAILDSLTVDPGDGRRAINATLVRLGRSRPGPLTEVDVATAILTGDGTVPSTLRAAGHDPAEVAATLGE